ncbi:MAG: hypothetical protein JZU50_06140 [Desulfobulbaceae bacterium]|nr:hypothetical protein [Desulfobulbaceae bacterium]
MEESPHHIHKGSQLFQSVDMRSRACVFLLKNSGLLHRFDYGGIIIGSNKFYLKGLDLVAVVIPGELVRTIFIAK